MSKSNGWFDETGKWRTKGKYGIGTVHDSNHHGKVEVINHKGGSKRDVEFLDTGIIKRDISIAALLSGELSPKQSDLYDIGTKHPSSRYGDMEIIKYIDPNKRDIKFVRTGTVVKGVNLARISSGLVADTSEDKYAVNTIHPTNKCGDIEIVKYVDKKRRDVRFITSGVIKYNVLVNYICSERVFEQRSYCKINRKPKGVDKNDHKKKNDKTGRN